MIQTLLLALLPVVFAVLLGLACAHWKIVEKTAAPMFARFVVKVALPLALLSGVLRLPADALANVPFLAAMFIGMFGTFLIMLAIGRFVFKNSLAASSIQALACAFPSMAYSGVPVLNAVVGDQGLASVVAGNLVCSIFMLPLAIILLEVDQGKGNHTSFISLVRTSVWDAVSQPLVWLPVVGAGLAIAGFHMPRALSIDLVGASAAGVALFTLGLILYGQKFAPSFEVLFNAAIKNIAQPAILFGLGLVFAVQGTMSPQLLLIGSIPTATAVSMIALRFNVYYEQAAATTFISTVGAIVTISIAIAIASSFMPAI